MTLKRNSQGTASKGSLRARTESVPQTQSKTKQISRRELLGNAVIAGAAFTIVPRHVLGGRGYTPPSGAAGRGRW